MELELFKQISKFPFIYEGDFYNSNDLKQNKTCINKCKEKDCFRLFEKNTSTSEHICSKGFDNILIVINKSKFIINGLIFTTNKTIQEGRKVARKEWVQEKSLVLDFAGNVMTIDLYALLRENKTTLKNFTIFHDFKTSMNIFFSCTQDIIDNLPGVSFEDKLKGSDKSYQDLFHSLRLITSQLRMIDIFINPSSITFGNKKIMNIYQLFEKIKILFGHMAHKKRAISINLVSDSWIQDSQCYDSIEFIPLILLDNALKYSAPDSDIEIKIEQHSSKAKISVKNIGPFVSDENKDRIFEKFFRDEAAKVFSKEGIGIGLWIAQEILKAHGTKLYYYKDHHETRPMGLNIFTFDLPTMDNS